MSSATLYGQSEASVPQGKELGLRFSGFNDFNLFYKTALKENVYRRHRFIFGRIGYGNIGNGLDINLGYAFGNERRRYINDEFGLYSGWELGFSYGFNGSELNDGFRSRQHTFTPSVSLVLGAFLELSPRFILSAEVSPTLFVSYSIFNREEIENRLTVVGEANTSQTALALMYRF